MNQYVKGRDVTGRKLDPLVRDVVENYEQGRILLGGSSDDVNRAIGYFAAAQAGAAILSLRDKAGGVEVELDARLKASDS